MKVKINDLKINPLHQKIYKINNLDELVDSIREHGLLEKIVVDPNMFIISGVRRLRALEILNYEYAEVEIKEFEEAEQQLTLIAYNKQRVKSTTELLNEAKYYKEIWGQKRGRKPKYEIIESDEEKQPADTRKMISEKLKISAGNLSKLEYIDSRRPDLLQKIDDGVFSINQVHHSLKKYEEEKNSISNFEILPTVITNDYYTICNKSSDNLTELNDESIQTIITSPPYWNKRDYSYDPEELGGEATSEEFVQRISSHLNDCWRVLKPGGSFFLNIGDTYKNKRLQCIPYRVVSELIKKGWILRNSIIWHKINVLPSNSKDNLTPSYEFIYHLTKNEHYDYYPLSLPKISDGKATMIINQKMRNNGDLKLSHVSIGGLKDGKQLTDFWTDDVIHTASANQSVVKKYGGTSHPAPFPAEICILPILQTSKLGDVVLDVFSGTSTVGEIALLFGRKYVGYELNPIHNDLQKNRLDNAVQAYNQSTLPNDFRLAA